MIEAIQKTIMTNFQYLGEEQPEWKKYIKVKHSLSEMELGYLDRFMPIIEYYGFDDSNLLDEISQTKSKFISSYGVWNKDLFLRQNPAFNEFTHSITEYINCIQRGKCTIVFQKDDTYFYWLKLPSEVETPNHQTMIISKLDIVELELSLMSILNSIDKILSDSSCKVSPIITSAEEELDLDYTLQNNFDHVSPDKLIAYFTEKLVLPGYLSNSELHQYMKLAFENCQKPKSRFVFQKSSPKKDIMQVFYHYFQVIASKPFGKKVKYVELLGEYFEGYSTESMMTNFSKGSY